MRGELRTGKESITDGGRPVSAEPPLPTRGAFQSQADTSPPTSVRTAIDYSYQPRGHVGTWLKQRPEAFIAHEITCSALEFLSFKLSLHLGFKARNQSNGISGIGAGSPLNTTPSQ